MVGSLSTDHGNDYSNRAQTKHQETVN